MGGRMPAQLKVLPAQRTVRQGYLVDLASGFIVDAKGANVAKIIGRGYSQFEFPEAINAAKANNARLYFIPRDERSRFAPVWARKYFRAGGAYVVQPLSGHENDPKFKSPFGLELGKMA